MELYQLGVYRPVRPDPGIPHVRHSQAIGVQREGVFTLEQFQKFFSQKYYSGTIINSFEVTVAVTAVTLLLGIPFAYFYSFY